MTDPEISMPRLAAIAVSGTDATEFLRAQLTTDVSRLEPGMAGLAAWCDAQGNTLAVFHVVPLENGYVLITSGDLIDALLKRLRMFVLRAAVQITDLRDSRRVMAYTGANAPSVTTENDYTFGRIDLTLNNADGLNWALALLPADSAGSFEAAIATDSEAFQLARVDAGVPLISTPTRASFIPQMLNLHWLNAVHFDKGCFPGQEVIARLQNRGRLTQRVFRYAWRGARPAAGDSVVKDEQSRGTVIRVAGLPSSEDSEGRLLAVVKTSAAEGEQLSTPGADLSLLNLPYPTPADARPDQAV